MPYESLIEACERRLEEAREAGIEADIVLYTSHLEAFRRWQQKFLEEHVGYIADLEDDE